MATMTARRDSKMGIQAFLVLDIFIRLLIWSSALTITLTLLTRFKLWPAAGITDARLSAAWDWGQAFSTAILMYNVAYAAILVVLRLPIPTPREGRYEMKPGGKLDRQLIWSALIAILTKARYEAPFPAFLVYQICNLPPVRWLAQTTLGPRSQSVNVTQPMLGDPHLIQLGRNVVIGYGASIAGHVQDRESVTIAKTLVEDDVLIGAQSLVYGGCTIKRGAVVLGGAVVRPFTTIGENEMWGGVPATKIKELPPIF